MAAKIRLVLVEKAWELKLIPQFIFKVCILRSSFFCLESTICIDCTNCDWFAN